MFLRLYQKNEVHFAILWIVLYCLITIPIRGALGDESIFMFLALLLIALGLTLFLRRHDLWRKHGLASWPKNAKAFLYFLPLAFLATGNLWGGVSLSSTFLPQTLAVLSMFLIGYIEEIIFRGFLFRGMLKADGTKAALIVSSVTFGIGHIVNLLAGQASLETILQVFFAIAWGFLFTCVYYKGGSLLPCILIHGTVNALSTFGKETPTSAWTYMGTTILVALLYCPYLLRTIPSEDNKE